MAIAILLPFVADHGCHFLRPKGIRGRARVKSVCGNIFTRQRKVGIDARPVLSGGYLPLSYTDHPIRRQYHRAHGVFRMPSWRMGRWPQSVPRNNAPRFCVWHKRWGHSRLQNAKGCPQGLCRHGDVWKIKEQNSPSPQSPQNHKNPRYRSPPNDLPAKKSHANTRHPKKWRLWSWCSSLGWTKHIEKQVSPAFPCTNGLASTKRPCSKSTSRTPSPTRPLPKTTAMPWSSPRHGGESPRHGGESLRHLGESLRHFGESLRHLGESLRHGGESLRHGVRVEKIGRSFAETRRDFVRTRRGIVPTRRGIVQSRMVFCSNTEGFRPNGEGFCRIAEA